MFLIDDVWNSSLIPPPLSLSLSLSLSLTHTHTHTHSHFEIAVINRFLSDAVQLAQRQAETVSHNRFTFDNCAPCVETLINLTGESCLRRRRWLLVPESAACASKSERQPDQTRYPPSQLTDVKIATIKIIVIKMIVIMRRRTTLGVGLRSEEHTSELQSR